MNQKHNDRAHAPLSPSGAKRWMSCPGSYPASEGIETAPSDASLEGTEAHEWIEKLCRAGDQEAYSKLLRKLENKSDDMAYHVDGYIDFLDKLKDNFTGPDYVDYEEYIETRVRFTDLIWGTLDYGLARKHKNGSWQAIVSDYKHGKGVYVSSKENPQIIIYLIGLEEHLGIRFEKAWMYIYQPRIPKDKPFEKVAITRDEITEWRNKILQAEKVCISMTRGPTPLVFKAGEHCQFCPAQPGCKEFRKHMQSGSLKVLDSQPSTFPKVETVPIEVLVQLHKKKKEIEHYLENVDHFLLNRGMRKQNIGDLKVVEGRSVRRWKDDEDLVALGLKKLGVQPFKKKMINIGEAEKIVGKNKIDHLTTKPPGKLQLAAPDDERPKAQLGKNALSLLD